MILFSTRFRRLFLGVVFFFIGNPMFSQTKREQIDVLINQRDSLLKLTLQQNNEIKLLEQSNLERSELIEKLEVKTHSLSDQINLKNNEITALQSTQTCLTAENFRTVESNSGIEPSIIETCIWNGFIITLEKEGFQTTYPSRLYGFHYELENVSSDFPVGMLFNEKRSILEKQLNELVKTELIKREIPISKLINYYFPIKDHDDGDGAIAFFIDHNIATFYFHQFIYGVEDRLEIDIPLNELNEYLIDVKDSSFEEKLKFCSRFETSILIEVNLQSVELGDASNYVEFIVPNSLERFNFNFASWLFDEQDIDKFCEEYWKNGKSIYHRIEVG